MEQTPIVNSYTKGFRDGVPIALGYLSVSFTFGMMAVSLGLPVWGAVLISMTNLTSAGQFAGLSLIVSGAPMVEMALTQLIINLRYALMSLSLSQKLDKSVNTFERCLIAFGNTDEIFAVSSGQKGAVGKRYMAGLITAPYFGWALGTLIGAAASTILPASIRSALGIAIYGMFIAIIIPPAKHLKSVRIVLLFSVGLSCLFAWAPLLRSVSSGFVIIICTILAAAFGAKFFPIEEAE
ncbi:AzlC family ABC transporter permease [Zongyangia hominis]|uniref:AzlC family ABC transporter permease n=1 Tax=Zongyangia hominis TaxID=2763677 RepID=A0A926EFE3_9FIRM|nr:AzlC family ABC transporter permease [Zongyangia hominis]MBC8571164.1 AzlC family ABC transporter permease [Zongyangia hominis]